MAIVEGVAMWASVTTPNTTYTPSTRSTSLLMRALLMTSVHGASLSRTWTRASTCDQAQSERQERASELSPKLLDRNKEPLNVSVGNGSKVRVQYKGGSQLGTVRCTRAWTFKRCRFLSWLVCQPRRCRV